MPRSYYPPKTLKEALVIPKAIYEKNAGNPMFRITLATELDLRPNAKAFRALITASSGYGMTIGSYIAEKIELESLGIDIVKGNTEAIFDALFSNELFQRFYEFFGTGGSKSVPSEKASFDFLRDKFGAPDRQINGILENILADARDWLLIQDIAGSERFVPKELAMQTLGKQLDQKLKQQKEPPPTSKDAVGQAGLQTPITPPTKVKIAPNLQLNIEIHIGADTPDDKIEEIFKNMKKYLLTDE